MNRHKILLILIVVSDVVLAGTEIPGGGGMGCVWGGGEGIPNAASSPPE